MIATSASSRAAINSCAWPMPTQRCMSVPSPPRADGADRGQVTQRGYRASAATASLGPRSGLAGAVRPAYGRSGMVAVAVAQLVELWLVVPAVAGSSPVCHPFRPGVGPIRQKSAFLPIAPIIPAYRVSGRSARSGAIALAVPDTVSTRSTAAFLWCRRSRVRILSATPLPEGRPKWARNNRSSASCRRPVGGHEEQAAWIKWEDAKGERSPCHCG